MDTRGGTACAAPVAKRLANGEKVAAQEGKRRLPDASFEPLDDLERALQEADEKGSFKLLPDQDAWREALRQAARATLAKNRHISLRLNEKDLRALQTKAAALGIPYQTLIGSILHQYAEGKIQASF